MQIIFGIVLFLIAIFVGTKLWVLSLLVALIIHLISANKKVMQITNNGLWFEKYKLIVKPFILINGIILVFTNGILFNMLEKGKVGFLYMLLFGLGFLMITMLSLPTNNKTKSIEDCSIEPQQTYKSSNIISTVLSFIMCSVMLMQVGYRNNSIPAISENEILSDTATQISTLLETEQIGITSSITTLDNSIWETEISDTTSYSNDITSAQKATETSITTTKVISETTTSKAVDETTVTQTTKNNTTSSRTEAHFNDYDIPEQQKTTNYVLNTSTMKIHNPKCNSVKKIKPENYSTTDDYKWAISKGYEPCKKCEP